MATHYDVLGIDADATRGQIRSAYYIKLESEKANPNVLQAITAAYNNLRTDANRKVYDKSIGIKPVEPEKVTLKQEDEITKNVEASDEAWLRESREIIENKHGEVLSPENVPLTNSSPESAASMAKIETSEDKNKKYEMAYYLVYTHQKELPLEPVESQNFLKELEILSSESGNSEKKNIARDALLVGFNLKLAAAIFEKISGQKGKFSVTSAAIAEVKKDSGQLDLEALIKVNKGVLKAESRNNAESIVSPEAKAKEYRAAYFLVREHQDALPLKKEAINGLLKALSLDAFNFTTKEQKGLVLKGFTSLLANAVVTQVESKRDQVDFSVELREKVNNRNTLDLPALMELNERVQSEINLSLQRKDSQDPPSETVDSAAPAHNIEVLRERLDNYIAHRQESLRDKSDEKKSFLQNFSRLGVSRDLNREVNVKIAETLLEALDKPGVCVDSLFSPDSIQKIKNGIMATDHFKDHPHFKDRGMNSPELKGIIDDARHPVAESKHNLSAVKLNQ